MYNKSTKFIKCAELGISGDTNVQNIAVIDTVGNGKFVDEIKVGVGSSGGIFSVFQLPNFDYFTKINPATAEYAESFSNTVSKMTQAIIKTNLIDCVVAVADSEVTAYGVLSACMKVNCPLLFAPVGVNNFDGGILSAAGLVCTRKIKPESADEMINRHSHAYGYPASSVTAQFFKMAERLGLTSAGISALPFGSKASLNIAREIGRTAVDRATTITTPKMQLSNKKTVTEIINSAAADGIAPAAIIKYKKIFESAGIKVSHDFLISPANKNIVLVRGSACYDGGYVHMGSNTPLYFSGSAWVYEDLEAADDALQSNAIDKGIIVVRNCIGQDISIIARAIIALGREKEIAIATDGECEGTGVLTVTNAEPNGFANEEFANIQTGDTIEIDIARGRFNTSVSAKEMKIRGKRNEPRQREVYFE
jgi:dihydroxyacid dehydratase/phosphogluconate dehydratase